MNDASSQELQRLLRLCAQSLKNACVRETGVIYTVASGADRVPLLSPCLAPGLKVDDLDLNRLPPLLYGTGALTPEDFVKVWDAAAALINGHKADTRAIHKLLVTAAPGVPFTTPKGGDVRWELVQFLQVGSWLGGRMHYTNTSAWLTIAGCRLGLDGQSIDWSAGHRRTRRVLNFRPREATRLFLGSTKVSTARAGAVLRYVAKVAPELVDVAHMAFATAAHAGPDFESIMADAFDVEMLDLVELKSAKVWKAAFELVDKSSTNPREPLAALLVPIVGLEQFDAHIRVTPLYSSQVRSEYRGRLLGLQASLVRQAKFAADPHGDGKDVAALLSLQQQLGTRTI